MEEEATRKMLESWLNYKLNRFQGIGNRLASEVEYEKKNFAENASTDLFLTQMNARDTIKRLFVLKSTLMEEMDEFLVEIKKEFKVHEDSLIEVAMPRILLRNQQANTFNGIFSSTAGIVSGSGDERNEELHSPEIQEQSRSVESTSDISQCSINSRKTDLLNDSKKGSSEDEVDKDEPDETTNIQNGAESDDDDLRVIRQRIISYPINENDDDDLIVIRQRIVTECDMDSHKIKPELSQTKVSETVEIKSDDEEPEHLQFKSDETIQSEPIKTELDPLELRGNDSEPIPKQGSINSQTLDLEEKDKNMEGIESHIEIKTEPLEIIPLKDSFGKFNKFIETVDDEVPGSSRPIPKSPPSTDSKLSPPVTPHRINKIRPNKRERKGKKRRFDKSDEDDSDDVSYSGKIPNKKKRVKRKMVTRISPSKSYDLPPDTPEAQGFFGFDETNDSHYCKVIVDSVDIKDVAMSFSQDETENSDFDYTESELTPQKDDNQKDEPSQIEPVDDVKTDELVDTKLLPSTSIQVPLEPLPTIVAQELRKKGTYLLSPEKPLYSQISKSSPAHKKVKELKEMGELDKELQRLKNFNPVRPIHDNEKEKRTYKPSIKKLKPVKPLPPESDDEPTVTDDDGNATTESDTPEESDHFVPIFRKNKNNIIESDGESENSDNGGDSGSDSDEEGARKELLGNSKLKHKKKGDSTGKKKKSSKNNENVKLPPIPITLSSDSDEESPKPNPVKKKFIFWGKQLDELLIRNRTEREKKAKKDEVSDTSDIEILDELPVELIPSKKRRRNIKDILGTTELDKETIKALKSEKDAQRRINKQNANLLCLPPLPSSEVVEEFEVEPLVLDRNPDTNEPLVVIDKNFARVLKAHQVDGVKFMFERTIESVKQFKINKKSVEAGCVLAHCMGLGKTLQAITFLHTVMTNEHLKEYNRRALVICPLTTILNWISEFEEWQANCPVKLRVHNLAVSTFSKNTIPSIDTLKDCFYEWELEGGVGLINMESFTNYTSKAKFKSMEFLHQSLLNPGPDIVICDEGHKLKNAATKFVKAIYQIRTKNRIVLTGTPLQNNLNEYYQMINWVKRNLLGTLKEFRNQFVNPIENGQHIDSTDADVNIMKKRSHVLHKIIKGRVQRKNDTPLRNDIPLLYEYVVRINMSTVQIGLYQKFIDFFKAPKSNNGGVRKRNLLLAHHHILEKLLAHPYILADEREKRGGCVEEDMSEIEWLDESDHVVTKVPIIKSENPDEEGTTSDGNLNDALGNETINEAALFRQVSLSALDSIKEYGSKEKYCSIEMSGKTVALMAILQLCIDAKEKLLVFSHRVTTLNMIAGFLTKEIKVPKSEMIGPLEKTWVKNKDFYLLDGKVNQIVRKEQIKKFNQENNRLKLFLISTRAGGLGINLTAANRVVIFDASWNPADDLQSIYRIYRYGQKKPCFVYRFVARATMEEKVYYRQIGKESLAKRVVDEEQIKRHHKIEETSKLYDFNKSDLDLQRECPNVPEDEILAKILFSLEKWIFSYHLHDSLLKNQENEKLSEEERKIAWDEYNAEKAKKTPVGSNLPQIPNELYILAVFKQKIQENNSKDNLLTPAQIDTRAMQAFLYFRNFQYYKSLKPAEGSVPGPSEINVDPNAIYAQENLDKLTKILEWRQEQVEEIQSLRLGNIPLNTPLPPQ